MVCVLIGIVIGVISKIGVNYLYKRLRRNKSKLIDFWKRHPWANNIVVIALIPIYFIILLPIDWIKNDVTFYDYVETIKQCLK